MSFLILIISLLDSGFFYSAIQSNFLEQPTYYFVYNKENRVIIESFKSIKNEIYDIDKDTLIEVENNIYQGKYFILNLNEKIITKNKLSLSIKKQFRDNFEKSYNYYKNRNFIFKELNLFSGTFITKKENEYFYLPHDKFLELNLKYIYKQK